MKKKATEESMMRKLLMDAALEKPSPAFSANVLKAISAREVAVKEYEPLISRKAWIGIALVAGLSVWGLYLTSSGNDYYLSFRYFENISFPKIELSPIMSFAIGLLSLFFLEIPFLKRFLERQYD